jgi:hypothetical protein
VTFVEQAKDGGTQIGIATGSHGSISFVPSTATTSARSIVAHITLNGNPGPSITVAHYTAQAPRPGVARAINVTRRGHTLVVSFLPAPLALRHIVAVTLSDGESFLLATKAGGHAVLVPGIPVSAEVTRLTVTGLRYGIRGPSAVYVLPGSTKKRHKH